MINNKKTYLQHLLLLLVFSLSCVQAKTNNWIEVKSPHLSIYTDHKEKKAKEYLTGVEQFRTAVLQYMNLPDKPENQRLKIIMFRKSKNYKRVAPEGSAGYYRNSEHGPRMVVNGSHDFADSSVLLFHEYAHYLLREHANMLFPKWYDEGLAEFLASAVLKKDGVYLGGLHPWRKWWLKQPRWVPLEQLISPLDKAAKSNYWSRFYASSWLTVHFLEFGPIFGEKDYSTHTRCYLNNYNQGIDATKTFEKCFETTVAEMQKVLQRYRRTRFNRVMKFPVPRKEVDLTTRVLSKNESLFVYADLAWGMGKEDVALEALEDVDKQQKDAALPLSLKAILENHKGETEEMHKLVEYVIDSAAENAVAMSNVAHFYKDIHEEREKAGTLSKEDKEDLVDKVLEYASRAAALDPNIRSPYLYLLGSYNIKGEPMKGLKALMASYKIEPANPSLNWQIGRQLAQMGYPEKALTFLVRAKNWIHNERNRSAIQKDIEEARASIGENSNT